MPPTPRRRTETGLRRRKPKRQATANERWLHLGAGKASLMFTLHVVMGTALLFCLAMHQLLALIVAAEGVVIAHADLDVLHVAFDLVSVTLVGFLGLLCALRVTDKLPLTSLLTRRMRLSSTPAQGIYVSTTYPTWLR